MDDTYWKKQTAKQPLFPELLWSRPENRRHAGKLLIVGGNTHGFVAPAEAYGSAAASGVGVARVLLPESLKKQVGPLLESVEYTAHTPSGSFARGALSDLLEHSAWADGVVLAGDFGRNSETAILLETYVQKYSGQLTVTQDAADYFLTTPSPLLNRPATCLVLTMAQLQRVATGAGYQKAFTTDMDLLRLVAALHEFSLRYTSTMVIKHLENVLIAVDGKVTSTHLANDLPAWNVRIAGATAVWWLQNQSKPLESLTTALVSHSA